MDDPLLNPFFHWSLSVPLKTEKQRFYYMKWVKEVRNIAADNIKGSFT